MLSQYKLKDYNFILILLVAALSVIGIMLVGSADPSLRSRQMYGAIAGAAIMIVISLFDYSWILNFTRILYVVNLGFLVIVLLTGDARKGASRWLQIGSFQFQPTELAKILLILFFAMYFMKNEESINTPGSILKSVLLLLPPLALIAMQPDLKNTITITLIFFLLIYVAGLSYRRIGTILLIIIPAAAIFLLLVTQTNLPLIKE